MHESRDISEAFPNGEVSQYFRNDWLTQMCRETRANKEFAPRTQETARWAREQIKRQAGKKIHNFLSVSCWPKNNEVPAPDDYTLHDGKVIMLTNDPRSWWP